MTKPIIKDTDRKGVLEAYRKDGEQPFARIFSPSFRGTRTWRVCYRNGKTQTFNETQINISLPNREAIELEMQFSVDYCNDYQLGLSNKVPA